MCILPPPPGPLFDFLLPLLFFDNRILAAIGLGFIVTVVGFKVVVPDDPYAMLDDTYLNTLKGDDKIANDAARKVRFIFCAVLLRGCSCPTAVQAASKNKVATGGWLFVLTDQVANVDASARVRNKRGLILCR